MHDSAKRPGRRMVIFADGTGSAFSQQESNVWRLYRAMLRGADEDGTLQLACYIPGVGTSSLGVIRYLDGAIGFGVPSNVRKLYRFLCWNWQPGDEIFLFGFSRGAFTVRTLAGMIRFQGLMPCQQGDHPVTEAEMNRNVMAAWLAYRRATAPSHDAQGRRMMAPWVGGIRALRDWLGHRLRAWRGLAQHDDIRRSLPPERRPPPLTSGQPDVFGEEKNHIRIKYMGVFDTVEAYGMPFDEARRAFSYWFWPITFRNRVCSRIVERADHLLSLDDQRLTFHPIRFDQTGAGTDAAPARIRELWFAGAHSDIGGGYPDDAAAMDPLVWMAEAAKAEGLCFRDGEIESHAAERTPQGTLHDSRAAFGKAYRYAPRPRDADPVANGGPPVLHVSVLDKMRRGYHGYAPLDLPATLRVTGGPDEWGPMGPDLRPVDMLRSDGAEQHVAALVQRRKQSNRVLNMTALLLVLLPLAGLWATHPLAAFPVKQAFADIATWLGAVWQAVWLSFRPLARLYLAVWPVVAGLLAVFAVVWIRAGALDRQIKDFSLQVWHHRV